MAALMLHYDWTMVEMAEREFKRAIELNPNYGSARFWYSTCVLLTTQRYTEAKAEIDAAVRLDPLSPAIRTAAASVYLCSGEPARAVHEARRALDLDPNYIEGSYALGTALRVSGQAVESIAILEAVREKNGAGYWTLSHLGMAYAAAGRREDAAQMLSQLLQLPFQSHVGIAWIHLALGEMDEAVERIRQAAQSRDQRLRHLACAPHYARLWEDPRYAALIREFGLDPQQRQEKDISLSGFRLEKTSY
jgi:tetratricopeptide (TPR) repeat protein